jgi:kynurenine formamidase
MVFLKTYFHPEKGAEPEVQFHTFESDAEAIEFLHADSKEKGLGITPDPSIHYYEFLSQDEYEAQNK